MPKFGGRAISSKMKRIFEVRMDQGLQQPCAHRAVARLYGDATVIGMRMGRGGEGKGGLNVEEGGLLGKMSRDS